MDHYYKYEGMSEEIRNGLIPFMHVPEALRIDPEDSGRSDEPKPNKTSPGLIAEPAKGRVERGSGYQRKTRDVYILLGNYGNGFEEEGPETDTWREMKQLLKEYRDNCPQYRYSYRKRRIRINTQ